ncbi:DNA mismatch repair protein MutS domain protein [Candidatus Moduliflexus flocculans]|uniref:DNA mismatch repair protein MutS domain protein n=1 Tax=Candidatus Moduliflexus flocculans TaxID=1499966 RepID=A0A081BS03_9BACT|nr:DNA mismatch repair protein MutS domain protein [Candidatus Moduliflexus flocculans]
MNVFLMYRDRDFDAKQNLPAQEQTLTQDLELHTLFNAMAAGDQLVFDIARTALLCGVRDPETIRYRQAILKDCLKNASLVREMYQISIESVTNKQRDWLSIFRISPASILSSTVAMLQMFVELLKKLRRIANEHAEQFESEGFATFFAMIKKELDDNYFATIQTHLRSLKFRDGVLLSAKLGAGNEGAHYILRKPHDKKRHWFQRIRAKQSSVYKFSLHPRDDHGARVLSELQNIGINLVANAVAQSAEHIDNFFTMLRIELAFYIGCLNLYEQLVQLGQPICFPQPVDSNARQHLAQGLYDVCLALTMRRSVVGNVIHADRKDVVIITGANQGGKSTFLRSIGVAQLMMQCGMFAPAESFCANICEGLFTHYKRQEDATMTSGKLDEELHRMNGIVDMVTSHSLILFNESLMLRSRFETNDRILPSGEGLGVGS